MELQKVADDLDTNDVALFAISYDSVETLQGFAEARAITYPLLADEGSRTIRALGMYDDELDQHHAAFGRGVREDQRGVAYPGVFLLDRDGVVTGKRFHENYRGRDTGGGLLEAVLGIAAPRRGAAQHVGDEVVNVHAYLDTPTYRPHQMFQLVIELTVQAGYHVYATPVPYGYVPLNVTIVPLAGLRVMDAAWPVSHAFRVAGLDEDFEVLEGHIRGRLPLSLTSAEAGDEVIDATVRYQACSDTVCLPPATLRFELPLRLAEAVQ